MICIRCPAEQREKGGYKVEEWMKEGREWRGRRGKQGEVRWMMIGKDKQEKKEERKKKGRTGPGERGRESEKGGGGGGKMKQSEEEDKLVDGVMN